MSLEQEFNKIISSAKDKQIDDHKRKDIHVACDIYKTRALCRIADELVAFCHKKKGG